MLNKGQLLLEVVLILGLVVIILGIFASALIAILSSQRYLKINQAVALSGFEKYRSALISLSQENFNYLNNLSPTTDYYLTSTANSWEIREGKEEINIGNEKYFFSFRINNFQGNPNIKFVIIKGEYQDLIFEDYFLLPKLNVSF